MVTYAPPESSALECYNNKYQMIPHTSEVKATACTHYNGADVAQQYSIVHCSVVEQCTLLSGTALYVDQW